MPRGVQDYPRVYDDTPEDDPPKKQDTHVYIMSWMQRDVADATKLLIQNAVSEQLNPRNFPGLETFYVADLGCSVGPNTFIAVQNIIDAVKLKYQSSNDKIPEFQVLFNDHTQNDFNTLFKSLPLNREYYASGVPGSFHSNLFPRASLHFVHTSYSLQWLSCVPKEVITKNKGRIYHFGAPEEVTKAYARQHATDFANFLQARAHEIVPGGLMVIVLPSRPNGVSHSRVSFNILNGIFSSTFVDLAKKGMIDEEKVDTFNLPIYPTSPQELEATIKQNGCFSIEKIESLPKITTADVPHVVSLGTRAITEGLIKEHFGEEILDGLFEHFTNKLVESLKDVESGLAVNLFLLLKRKDEDNTTV
ncbi:hypothetical protein RD792_014822 [Penstemon davidsonii]|uniref:S-adenosylmethionine-dependent methyltransferase n=1 Tax=Penstemon davidsonii TaxID=160366 RepID=A0ABR0CQB8_9LAMI|nr:hypothetical protein RD792_014822 [Penstemon davidsonii]